MKQFTLVKEKASEELRIIPREWYVKGEMIQISYGSFEQCLRSKKIEMTFISKTSVTYIKYKR